MTTMTKMTVTGEGGGDGDDGDGGDVTVGRKRRGRMKGGAVATTTALSNVDVNATGCRGKDERARVDGPAYAPRQQERLIVVVVMCIHVCNLDRRSRQNGLRDAAHVRPAPPTRQQPGNDAQLVGACHGRIERRGDSWSQCHARAQATTTPRTGAAVICIRFLPNETKILKGGMRFDVPRVWTARPTNVEGILQTQVMRELPQ